MSARIPPFNLRTSAFVSLYANHTLQTESKNKKIRTQSATLQIIPIQAIFIFFFQFYWGVFHLFIYLFLSIFDLLEGRVFFVNDVKLLKQAKCIVLLMDLADEADPILCLRDKVSQAQLKPPILGPRRVDEKLSVLHLLHNIFVSMVIKYCFSLHVMEN